MTSRLLGLAIAAVRCWTRVYTWRMSPAWAERRRAEIDSDLWELQHDPEAGRGLAPAAQVLARLCLGVFDDLCWRAEQAAFEDTLLGRKGVALAAAAALVVIALWTIPAWIRQAAPIERTQVLDCASDFAPPQTRAELRMRVVNCAGAFFKPSRNATAGRIDRDR